MIKTKTFASALLSPLVVPDGSSLEELVNAFLATLDPKDVLDVLKESTSTGKYGLTTTHFGTVIYREV
jgi:hypothetical protein